MVYGLELRTHKGVGEVQFVLYVVGRNSGGSVAALQQLCIVLLDYLFYDTVLVCSGFC